MLIDFPFHSCFYMQCISKLQNHCCYMHIAVICDPLSNPTNGLITYSPDTTPPYEFETMASYRCNEGFGLTVGDTTRICVNSVTVSEQWSGIEPECAGEVFQCWSLINFTSMTYFGERTSGHYAEI